MRKFISFISVIAVMVFLVINSSCSTAKSVNSSFVKNGYTMEMLSPQQQAEIAPVVNVFPPFNHNALGYVQTENTATFIYEVDEAIWDSYCNALEANGFTKTEIGFVKGDKVAGMTYKISSRFTTIYKQTYLLVTYAHGRF